MGKQKTVHSLPPATHPAVRFLHQTLVHTTGALGFLISISFFTATYDTAQVKLTLLHMGALLLLALWSTLKITQRQSPFTKNNLPFLLPVFVYVGWNVLCYTVAPLHLDGTEEFVRFVLYGAITLLAATEFSFADVKTLTKWILAAVWISFLYALVQVGDRFFPGIDPMPWRGFFTGRIFSTHANPNFFADFVLFTSCLLVPLYLINRQKKYVVLAALGALALWFTESKGAWLAYVLTGAVGTLLYTNYCAPTLTKYRRKINLLALVAVVGVSILVGVYTAKRFQSVSFRAHTWLGTLELIKDHPALGVGTGNFKTFYSAYRRPQIFYIESSHNVETQHAENELLEQWAVSGTVGLAIFLWLLYFVFTGALRCLKRPELSRENKLYLLAYTTALAGMFIHSWVDISIRFASSGFFFALFIGILLALCYHNPASARPTQQEKISWLTWLLRAGITLGLGILIVLLMKYFYLLMAVLRLNSFGEVLLFVSAWAVFLACIVGASYLLLRATWLIHRPIALLPLLLVQPLLFCAYAPFQANHLYSIAITLNNQKNIEGALEFFTRAIQLDPFKLEYRQFRANVLTATFNLTKQFAPFRGDKTNPSDDYTRALQDFAFVARHSPNHALLHHNQGQLYYKMALTRSDEAAQAKSPLEYNHFKQEALHNMELAKQSFERSLQSDPVNPDTYMYLVQIALLENEVEAAQNWLNRFWQGPQGVTEEEFLQRNRTYLPAKALQAQVNARQKLLASTAIHRR